MAPQEPDTTLVSTKCYIRSHCCRVRPCQKGINNKQITTAKTRLWLMLLLKEWAMAPQEPHTTLHVGVDRSLIWSGCVRPLNGVNYHGKGLPW